MSRAIVSATLSSPACIATARWCVDVVRLGFVGCAGREDAAHRGRAACGARARPARGRDDRAGAHDGRAARGPPLADPPRARAVRRGRRVAVRQPAQFDERADLERYPRREREDAALAAQAGADLLFAPSIEEVYPPGFATVRRGAGRHRPAGGRGPRRRAFPRREHGRHEAAVHGSAGRRLLRPEGRSAGRGHPPAGRATSTCPFGSRSARRCASPTDWRCPAATPCSAPPSASARSRSERRCARPVSWPAPASVRSRRCCGSRRRDGPVRRRAGVPGDRRPRHVRAARRGSRSPRCSCWPRASARSG